MSIGIIILNFLRKHWLPIILVSSVFALYFYVQYLRNTVENLKDDIIELSAQLSACKTNISDRNNIIEEWSDKTLQQNKEMETIKTEISKLTAITDAQIKKILERESPKTCEETVGYFIDMGKRYE